MSARLVSLVVHGDPGAWSDAGFVVDHDRITLVNGSIELTDAGEPGALVSMTVADVPSAGRRGDVVDVDGVELRLAPPGGDRAGVARVPAHPVGAFELDHVVVVTDSIERTSAAIHERLGLEQRRVRDTGAVRQAFHRFRDEAAGRGCILELVERTDAVGAALWGFVVNVGDLEAAVELLGPERCGQPKPAVQPGRSIATLRRGAALGVPLALMTPA